MKNLKFLLATMLTVVGLSVWSQVAINTDGSNPHASAMLDVSSTTRGMLVPRMTSAQRDLIPSPAEGLMVYCTDMDLYYFYNGSVWTPFGSGGSGSPGWTINGNNMYSAVTGNVGIGTASPTGKLHVVSSTSAYGMARIQNSNTGQNEASLAFMEGLNVVPANVWTIGVGCWSNPGDFIIGKGTEKLKLDASGNLGIGTADIDGNNNLPPKSKDGGGGKALSHRFTVANLSSNYVFRLVGPGDYGYGARLNFGDGNFAYIEEDEDDNLNIRANRVSFSAGLVGIGTISPWGNLDIRGDNANDGAFIQMGNYDISHKIQIFSGDNINQNPYLLWTDGNHMRFITNKNGGTEMMRITADGNVGIGTNAPSEKLTVRGNILIESSTGEDIVELGEGLDFAEGFDVSDAMEPEPGTVLIIDPDHPGELKISEKAYDSRVAGIVAGASDLGSGVKLGSGKFDCNVALAGRVYCKVDASFGEVMVGDLLTTSPTPGYAMVVRNGRKDGGAILGKAMECLEKGKQGEILVLVTLQ